jgi:Rps23 Pro-64 3,4-dihydroxylase Tpa1-like proline 4-hydroxylase
MMVYDFFDKESYDDVFKEILFLVPLLKNNYSDSAYELVDDQKIYKKRGSKLWIDYLFPDRTQSKILTHYSQLFCSDIKAEILKHDWFFSNYFNQTNFDSTLLQSYGNGDYYKPHRDNSVFTSVLLMHSKPKEYAGGEFIFPDYNLNIELIDNSLIIFPSCIRHEVAEVSKKTKKEQTNRFTLTKFITFKLKSD